jgi:6-phosphogluconate dehydrogenase
VDPAASFGDNVWEERRKGVPCILAGATFAEEEKVKMEIAMIGLGKMGANMTTRLLGKGHRVVAFDVKEEAVRSAEAGGAVGARTLVEAVGKLSAPRAVWVMVPAGEPTDATIMALAERLSPGDIVVDGGNSNYKDTMRRAASLKGKGLRFVDVGTSGGVWGLSEGYSMMVGGEDAAEEKLRPILEALAPAHAVKGAK